MSFENPESIIRSLNLQAGFSNARVSEDRLVPDKYSRVRQPFTRSFREHQLPSQVDWNVTYSWFLPESLRVVSSIFVEIQLPALGTGNYKECPGLYAIEQQRFLSAGTESYHVNPALFLREYLCSLTEEACDQFCKTYLGKTDVPSGAARTIWVPVFLPNSAYFHRHSENHHGFGAFPAYLGGNRLEVQMRFAPAENLTQTGADASGAISGNVKMIVHQIEAPPDAIMKYSDVRGQYSIVGRRLTEITNGWTTAQANVAETITQVQPLGTVTSLLILAVPTGTADAKKEILQTTEARSIKITADSIVQRDLESAQKCRVELWSNGFTGNNYCNTASRMCFNAHGSDDKIYSGGYQMSLSSQINVDVSFPAAVDYRVYAVQYQRVTINSTGHVQSSLE